MIFSAANPMMSYLSMFPCWNTIPCGGAPGYGGAPGPSQLIGKSRTWPWRASSAFHSWELGPFFPPTPRMPVSVQT